MAELALRKAFGAVVRNLRLEKGLSQEELAFEVGISRNYVSLVELGQHSPSLDKIGKLAKVFGLSASGLIARAERHLK